jgi:type II secretory pathway pseudopilin PulG
MTGIRTARGTTLVEAIVAIGILAGAVVAMAGLSSLAIRHAALARERSMATILATQKMEALCRDAASAPESPANAWSVDTPGFVEYLDAYGVPVAGPGGNVYVRRWSVTPLPSDPSLLAIQVGVSPCRTPPGAARCGDVMARARLAGVRSRIAW